MNLTLIKDWNSLRCGFRMAGVPAGQAELLIQKKIAVMTEIAVVTESKTELKRSNQQRNK